MNIDVTSIRLNAGTFNKDMQAPRSKAGKTSPLNAGSMTELKGTYPTGSDASGLSKKSSNANFTKDADMGLKGGGKKSGSY